MKLEFDVKETLHHNRLAQLTREFDSAQQEMLLNLSGVVNDFSTDKLATIQKPTVQLLCNQHRIETVTISEMQRRLEQINLLTRDPQKDLIFSYLMQDTNDDDSNHYTAIVVCLPQNDAQKTQVLLMDSLGETSLFEDEDSKKNYNILQTESLYYKRKDNYNPQKIVDAHFKPQDSDSLCAIFAIDYVLTARNEPDFIVFFNRLKIRAQTNFTILSPDEDSETNRHESTEGIIWDKFPPQYQYNFQSWTYLNKYISKYNEVVNGDENHEFFGQLNVLKQLREQLYPLCTRKNIHINVSLMQHKEYLMGALTLNPELLDAQSFKHAAWQHPEDQINSVTDMTHDFKRDLQGIKEMPNNLIRTHESDVEPDKKMKI